MSDQIPNIQTDVPPVWATDNERTKGTISFEDQSPQISHELSVVESNDDVKLKGAVAYVLFWLTGVIVLLIANNNKFLKFHAWQSIIFGIAVTIITFILPTIIYSFLFLGFMYSLFSLIWPLCWIYMLYGAYMVYTGKEFKIPIIADFVIQNFMK
jgi:uncharacterized membrane protein